MTDIEILAKCINTLGRINVPVDLTDQIAVPVKDVLSDLIMLYKAISEIREKKSAEEASKKEESDAEAIPEEINQNESGESEA